jgi:hypothetical protein
MAPETLGSQAQTKHGHSTLQNYGERYRVLRETVEYSGFSRILLDVAARPTLPD